MMTSGVIGEFSPAHREYAEIIHRSGHHLLDVVRMLLDMSRLEAGKFEIQSESFEAQELIEPCFKIVGQLAKERGIQLIADIARNLPQLIGDERACRQILINLLSNAIKFSHDKGTITVSIRRQNAMLARRCCRPGHRHGRRSRQPHRRAVLPGAGRPFAPL